MLNKKMLGGLCLVGLLGVATNVFGAKPHDTAATIVVAAANSLNKDGAHFVCDGKADDVELKAALAALPAFGGKILLREGDYFIDAAVDIVNKDKVVIEGMGWATRIQITPGTPWSEGKEYTVVFDCDKDSSNIVIKNLCIDGTNGKGAIAGVFFRAKKKSMAARKLGYVPISEAHVEGCLITRMPCEGILTNYRGDNKIINNTLEWNKGRGIHLSGACNNVVISGNNIRHSLSDGIFFCAQVRFVSICNNNFTGNQYGIDGLSNETNGYSDCHVVIANNTFMRQHRLAISLFGPVNTVIANNIIGMSQTTEEWRWKGDGIQTRGIMIGVTNDLKTSQVVIIGNSIGENRIESFPSNFGMDRGIVVVNADNIQIIGNQLGLGCQRKDMRPNNNCSPRSPLYGIAGVYGIEVKGNVKDLVIADNTIEDWLHGGILLRNEDGIQGVRIRDNIIKKTGYRDQQTGIVVEGEKAINTVIEGNVLSCSATQIVDKGTGTIIRGNRGFATEAAGQTAISAGQASIDVKHGLDVTPKLCAIRLTPGANPGKEKCFWVSDIGPQTFRVNLPAAAEREIPFGWAIGE